MKTNVGVIDRVVRAIVAVVIIGLYSTNVVAGTLGIILIVLSIVFLLTAFIGFCPLYLPFGINTLRKKK
jgi:hypothetical protein